MSTLAEIEAAAESLPTEQQEELLTFLLARLECTNRPIGESVSGETRMEAKLKSQTVISQPTTVLEAFAGVVNEIDSETAFVTLISRSGEELIGEFSAGELSKLGIHEHRRFICQTVLADGKVEVRFHPIPDLELTHGEEAAIDQEIDELISGGELDADY